jgi:hypothetical protein
VWSAFSLIIAQIWIGLGCFIGDTLSPGGGHATKKPDGSRGCKPSGKPERYRDYSSYSPVFAHRNPFGKIFFGEPGFRAISYFGEHSKDLYYQ